MTWSERLKFAWKTFLKEAPILYGWYLIFLAVAVLLIVIGSIIGMLALRSSPEFLSALSGFNSHSPSGLPFNPFPSSGFNDFPSRFNGHSYVPMLGFMIIFCLLIILFSWVVKTLFLPGAFNLTQKTLHEKPSFRDFSFSGWPRILAWFGLLLLFYLLVGLIGLIGSSVLANYKILLAVYLIVYFLLLLSIGVYLIPWFISVPSYLLASRNQSFWPAVSGSFTFFRLNMGKLWSLIGTNVLIAIALIILDKISSVLYLLGLLVAGPFLLILPIVWVLTLLEEQRPHTGFQPSFAEEQYGQTFSAPPYSAGISESPYPPSGESVPTTEDSSSPVSDTAPEPSAAEESPVAKPPHYESSPSAETSPHESVLHETSTHENSGSAAPDSVNPSSESSDEK